VRPDRVRHHVLVDLVPKDLLVVLVDLDDLLDATVDVVREEGLDVEFEPIAPAENSALDTHHCGPQALLRLCQVLNGAVPEAYLLTIRAHDTGFGDGLSLRARQAMRKAERLLMSFIQRRLQLRFVESAVQRA
jgi:Ni,Fe-hydrogenase maturation factor